MRSALLLAATAGLALITFAGPTPAWANPADSPVGAQEVTTVTVGDFFFCDSSLPSEACVTTVKAGDTIVWDYPSGTAGHTVTHCGDSCDDPTETPLWDSGPVKPGESFSFTLESPGTYIYRCDFHPVAMRATVVVQAPQTPTASPTPTPASPPPPTPTVTPQPTAAPTSAPSPAPATPAASAPNGDGDGISPWWFLLAGAGGLILLGGGFLVWRLRSERP